MTVVKIRAYRGAKILVLNDSWQTFLWVVYYKNQFYANEFLVTKRGEYTNREYMETLEAVLETCHRVIDKLVEKRSLTYKFKQTCQKLGIKLNINLPTENPTKVQKE